MRQKSHILLLLSLFFFACSRYFKKDSLISTSVIKGKVVYQTHALSGSQVYVYKRGEKFSPDNYFAIAPETDKNGDFSLNLPPGSYYLIVRKAADYFSYFGGNPINLSKGSVVELTINCVRKFSFNIDLPQGMKNPGISGVVYYEDKPIEDSEVFFYLDMETDLRGPAYFSTHTDKEGRFYAPLEQGTYYIVSRKRSGTEIFGPLQAGDFFGYYEDNPVVLPENENMQIPIFVLKKEITKDLKIIITPSGVTTADRAIISGVVYDLEKKPVKGVYVCLYQKGEMVGKPEYISNKTGDDGFFQINLSSGGKFYLIAKENFGNIPQPGDFIGYLSNSVDHSIEIIGNKKLTNVEVTGERILVK